MKRDMLWNFSRRWTPWFHLQAEGQGLPVCNAPFHLSKRAPMCMHFLTPSSVATSAEKLLLVLHQTYDDSVEEFICNKSRSDREGPALTPWKEVYHAIARLLSYFYAPKILLRARETWPELFEHFKVVPIASSMKAD